MIINLDIDGVIRDMVTPSIQAYKEQFDKHCKLKHDDIEKYDFRIHMPLITDTYKFLKDNKTQLFLNAKPYIGALEFVDFLKMAGHEIQIVTNQVRGTEDSTLQWLLEYHVPYTSLHFAKNKNSVKGDILIDDCIDNLIVADKKVVCVDRPWNKEWDGNKAYNYNDIYNYLK